MKVGVMGGEMRGQKSIVTALNNLIKQGRKAEGDWQRFWRKRGVKTQKKAIFLC